MTKQAAVEYRTADAAAPTGLGARARRWVATLGLLLLSVALLTFSFAPFGQFYLAWVGLVPWLFVVRGMKCQRAAFLWSWLAGILFFTANMWWLAFVTGPGLVALMVLLGLYWALAAVLIWRAGLLRDVGHRGAPTGREGRPETSDTSVTPALDPSTIAPRLTSRVLLIPAIWVALEWMRGNWPLNGLPWLFLGHPQTPILPMCQIADFAGVYGISFWVVAVNVLVFLLITNRFDLRRLRGAVAVVAAMLGATLAYGVWRMAQTGGITPGPTVMVVQSNYPQSNSGAKGATYSQLVDFHVGRTEAALRETPGVDLVIWSETMMPELNRQARALFRGREVGDHEDYGRFLDTAHERLAALASARRAGLLVGALYFDATARPDPAAPDGVRVHQDRRNVTYLYDRTGHMSDDPADRYDKVHIVPFGEYLPFKDTLPILHRLFVALSPYEEDYFLTPGHENSITVFRLDPATAGADPATRPAATGDSAARPWRFVTPICFEDIDPALVGKMFRGNGGPFDKRVKQADFIVNVTNDGWFKANEMPQHLQAARFRSIENRVATARSVNTGISGFVDTVGRTHGLIPAGVEGTSVQTLPLDARVTLYTRFGDVFSYACVAAALAAVAAGLVRWRRRVTSPG